MSVWNLIFLLLVVFLSIQICESSLPSNETCGVQKLQPWPTSTSFPSKRIVGGIEVRPWSWPWMALLKYDGILHCGGTLVKNNNGTNLVITAAHCVQFLSDITRWKVRLGVYSRAYADYETYYQEFNVSSVLVNPNFDPVTYANDIALIWLDEKVNINDGVSPICVTRDMYTVGESCVVTGWGTTSIGGETMDKLQEVYKPILSQDQCLSDYPDLGYDKVSMLCAGYSAGGHDACLKDSGGPMACNRGGIWYLVGIISWGFGCAEPNSPGVYTNVYNYAVNGWLSDNADI